MGSWIIRTEGLRKRYRGSDADAVEPLSLAIDEGTIHGILGPNGAGKTTTLSMLCGLLPPSGGRIEMADRIDPASVRRSLGLVPQDLGIYAGLTGRENLTFFASLYGLTGASAARRAADALSLVGLEERADDLARRYSAGMKRRLNLAAGLVHDPSILLLDEPTVGVDPQSRNRIFDSLLSLRSRGRTILYTTHYMEEASRICDRVAIMDRGRVLLEGSPRDLVVEHGRSTLVFEAGGATDDLAVEVSRIGHASSASLSGGILTVRLSGGADALRAAEEIGRIAASRGSSVRLASVSEPSLESVFLDLTGRAPRDDR